MNILTSTARVGREPELRQISGNSVLNFPAATDVGYGDRKQTVWLNCSVWGKRADSLAPILKKGSFVVFTGELSQREYEKDGQTRTSLEVRVQDIDIGPRQSSGETAGRAPDSGQDPIPF